MHRRMISARAEYAAAHERYATAAIEAAAEDARLGPPYDAEFGAVMDAAVDAWESTSTERSPNATCVQRAPCERCRERA